MPRRIHRALAAACLALTACTSALDFGPADPIGSSEDEMHRDIHSHAEPDQARVVHLALSLAADFERRVLEGEAALDLERRPDASHVCLDTDGLTIRSVTDPEGRSLPYTLDPRDPVLGSRLRVALEPGVKRIVVRYATAPDAAAVQWLAPLQTAGKRKPFLFTQGQAILTRTWIPLQDSPGIRMTYDATIEVPAGLTAVMSAERLTPDGEPRGDRTAFRFRMTHPIPGYLLALAIGELEFRSLGPRTGVFAEPQVIDAAAKELIDTESMVAAAERLYGPYRWGRYDVLVLPPSFPFGGMENPCVTFVTPTILAGDRSLVALIAHELAHSWSGNLVTNATWQDFWLNEGFTVYFENRITEELNGEEYAAMLQVLGFQDLVADVESFGRTNPDTKLYPDLAGRNPDDAFSNVPYEKGALFLRTLEQAVGRKRFDEFLRGYFDRFAFQSMTTQRFQELLRTVLFAGDASRLESLGVEGWLHSPGLPDGAAPPASARLARVEGEIARLARGARAAELKTADWSTHEWLHFLRKLPPDLAPAALDDLDATFAFSRTGNCEKRFEWLRVCIRGDRQDAGPSLEQFLTFQGRRKYLKPLYTDLLAKDWGKPLARSIYEKARPTYHSVSTNTIDKLMQQSMP